MQIMQSRRHFLAGLSAATAASFIGARGSLAQEGPTDEAAADVTLLEMQIRIWLSIIETALKVVVAVVAGLWAFFLLSHLKQRDRAIAEINERIANAERAQAETRQSENRAIAEINERIANTERTGAEIREIELKIRKEVKVSVGMDVDILGTCDGPILITTVEITNHGNEATRIKWRGEPAAFTVGFVTFDRDGKAQHGVLRNFPVTLTQDPSSPAVSHIIRAGTTEYLTFAFKPDRPGLYLFSFRGAVDKDVHKDAQKLGVQLPTAWTARRYFFVDSVSPACLPLGPGPEEPQPPASA